MPLNPLLARAIYEVSDYHRRYQPHLAQATSLLDIGVGPGLALQHVIQQNPHLTCAGVDVRDMRLPDVEIPLQVYDGHTLPFTKNQFDISLLLYVLHHCQDPLRLLDETIRVTRQKIILIEEFDLPGADEISLDLTERQSHRALGIPPDLPYQLFDRPEFESMLQGRNLIELAQQTLPSETTRPVQKYLYVMAVSK
jgi:SAM-dependent methyltransferase